MFLERRVYQGSSGKVYPLPFYGRISEQPRPAEWEAVYLENQYLRVMLLPQLGGRIHAVLDKTTGRDLIYRQDVIKPALVGLAGPWISGGIEFNWPQHHRPGTFMPSEVSVQRDDDGSVTVWMSDHEPMHRMKGMHGVRLRPDDARLEVRARLHNRTEQTQTFLWWANVAVEVHERYQSFFPPDVRYVADHAKRAISTFPHASGTYYGVDYATRRRDGVASEEEPTQFKPLADLYRPDDLSWYANIPVPTSYMVTGTRHDFFGGYDHQAGLGLVHVADRRIAPGKKQWTWGNHEFGYAWDRNLTEPDDKGVHRPYIELMAGVFTDNQPDFSFLGPGEVRTFSQSWYPIRDIGTPRMANTEAALSMCISDSNKADTRIKLGVNVTSEQPGTTLRVHGRGRFLYESTQDLSPKQAWIVDSLLPAGTQQADLTIEILDANKRLLLRYQPSLDDLPVDQLPPEPATEPASPSDIGSNEELYLTGLHLEQYRHATRDPLIYWREALRRDPGDARCNTAIGWWHYRRGEYQHAADRFRRSIARSTALNPNPRDGETYFALGLALRRLGLMQDACDSFWKATWNTAWQAAAFFAMAQIEAQSGHWATALDHANSALRRNSDDSRSRNLKVIALRHLGRHDEADNTLAQGLALDPLDPWANHLTSRAFAFDLQTRIDVALDYEAAGNHDQALALLREAQPPTEATPPEERGAWPLVHYHVGRLLHKVGEKDAAQASWRQAELESPDYCFPSRLEDMEALLLAISQQPSPRASAYVGSLLYHLQRREEAIEYWEQAVQQDPDLAVVWRNLGVAYQNVRDDGHGARDAYKRAIAAAPHDAGIFYEYDQLRRRLGDPPADRMVQLHDRIDLVEQRDDLSVELASLHNQAGQPEQALQLLSNRRFQPWEGGEGQALSQYVRARIMLGRRALADGQPRKAVEHLNAALRPPESLGEARHLLANASDVHRWLGEAFSRLGEARQANEHWQLAADFRGDFQQMSVQPFSELTIESILALRALGRHDESQEAADGLLAYAKHLANTTATIDYFATSLPTLLLFNDDLQARQRIRAQVLEAHARVALGDSATALRLLQSVLEDDPSHAVAADWIEDLQRSVEAV